MLRRTKHPNVCSAPLDLSPLLLGTVQACLARVWPRFTYSSLFGGFIGEDPKQDAWNAISAILRRRWLRLEQADPAAAELIVPRLERVGVGFQHAVLSTDTDPASPV